MNFFETDNLSALEAKEKAQWIAFAPVVFQATRVLRDSGILEHVSKNPEGLTLRQIQDHVKLPEYGVRVLVEAALGIGLLTEKEGVYKSTKTAMFILHDANVNNKLDKNFLGIPKEGYGASLNKLPFAAAPAYQDNRFNVKEGTTITLRVRIRNF